jgi:hypothetical protein
MTAIPEIGEFMAEIEQKKQKQIETIQEQQGTKIDKNLVDLNAFL